MDELLNINPGLRSEPICSYKKIYPNEIQIIKFKTPYYLSDGTADIQNNNFTSTSHTKKKSDEQKADEQKDKRLSKARTSVVDLVKCNPINMFGTLTANCSQCGQNCKNDPSLTDTESGCICNKATCKRYDIDYQRRNVFAWLDHQKKIHSYFSHIMVMELHEDGAPHFHFLFYGYTGKLAEHEIDPKDGKMVYNLVEYKRGHTTVKYITDSLEDYERCAGYLTKYIIKDMPLFAGRNRYVCSKGLRRPIVKPNPSDIETFSSHPEAKIWTPPTAPYISKRTKQIAYPKPTNVESITTVHMENTEEYLHEISLLQSQEPPRLSHFTRMALRARARLNRMSSSTRRGRLSDDSPRVSPVELGG